MNDTVGIFYELPDKKIASTYGFSDRGRIIMYCFDDGKGERVVSNSEFQQWKPRRDLRDFPNSSDPRLPYDFDLLYDIKYTSQLKRELDGHDYEDEIRAMMVAHNISI